MVIIYFYYCIIIIISYVILYFTLLQFIQFMAQKYLTSAESGYSHDNDVACVEEIFLLKKT